MNTKALGTRQKEIISVLKDGGCITSFIQLSPYEHTGSLWEDLDENDWYGHIEESQITALRKRGIIDGKMVYSTVQPDTEHYRFELTKEAVEFFTPSPSHPTGSPSGTPEERR